MRNSHQFRVRPSIPGVFRLTASQTRGKSLSASSGVDEAGPSPRARAAVRRLSADVGIDDLCALRRHAVPEAAVDGVLRGPQEGERLAARVHVVELRAHHRAEDAAAAVRRERADDGDAGGRHDRARHRELEREGPAPPTITPSSRRACMRSIGRFFEKRSMRSSVGSSPKYWPIAKTACPNSSRSRAGPNLERHQAIFSSGAYSTISRRSVPSPAKRTVTTPPGSMPVTMPSPSEPWRTASPVESAMPGARLDRRGGGRAVATPRGRPQPLALDLGRQLVEEARGEVVLPAPEQGSRHRVGHRQALHRTRHPDVAEPSLLLHALLLDRAGVREDPLLHPDDEDGRNSRPFALCSVMSVTSPRSSRIVSWSETSEMSWRKPASDASSARLPVLAGDADELLRGSRCGRAPRSCAPPRARRAMPVFSSTRSRSSSTWSVLRERHQRLHRRVETADGAARRRRDTRRLRDRPWPGRACAPCSPRTRRAAGSTCRRSPAAAGSRSAGATSRPGG